MIVGESALDLESSAAQSFKAPTGNTFEIYDGIGSFIGEPMDILRKNGFGQVHFAPKGPPYVSGEWFDGHHPPTYNLGQTEMTELTDAIDKMCKQVLSAETPALIIFDLEWSFFEYSYVDKTGKTIIAVDAATATRNQNNLILIAKTAYNRIHSATSPCKDKKAQFGLYGLFPTRDWWGVYYGSTNLKNQRFIDWQNNNDDLSEKLINYIDFLAPVFYAPYAPDTDYKSYPMTGLEFWNICAEVFLNYAKNLKKPIIPILGLRYYNIPESIYQNKFVDAQFFKSMLTMITNPIYDIKKIIIWDSPSTFGAKAADGTNVWSSTYPWITVTTDFFNITLDENIVDSKSDAFIKSGLLEF